MGKSAYMTFRRLRLTFATFGMTVAAVALCASLAIADIKPIGDTMLDISHSYVIASIIGCDVHSGDRVLVNGSAADGVAWDRLEIIPAMQVQQSQLALGLLRGMGKQPTNTLPQLKFRLKPGYYRELALSVGDCLLLPIPLVASDFYGLRHVTLLARSLSPQQDTALTASSSGVYGEVPILDLQVYLVNTASSNSYVARNEDDSDLLGPHYMFFFDSVIAGTYRFVVKGFGWEKDLGAITVAQTDQPIFKSIAFTDLGLKL